MEVRTKSNRIVKTSCISATADCVWNTFFTGYMVICCKQSFDFWCICWFIAWNGVVAQNCFCPNLCDVFFNGSKQLLTFHSNWITDIQLELKVVVFHCINAIDVGQFAGWFILYLYANTSAVAVFEYFCNNFYSILFSLRKLWQGCNQFKQNFCCIDGTFWFCCMSSFAHSSQFDSTLYSFYTVNSFIVAAKICFRYTFEGCCCTCTNCIAYCSANQIGDNLAINRDFDGNAQLTFFTDADREISIWCKCEGWHFFCFQIMWQVSHTSFFAASHYQTEGIIWLDTQLFHAFERIQTNNGWTFVICNATAIDVAVFLDHIIRIMAPAFTFRNNVQMTQNCNFLVAAAKNSRACVVIVVSGLEAHCLAHFQCFVQYFMASFAKWRIWVITVCADALNIDQFRNIVYDILSILFNKFVDSRFHFFGNHG